MNKFFYKFNENYKSKTQEFQQASSNMMKTTPRSIIIKLLKIDDKEKIIKELEKRQNANQNTKLR